MAVDSLDDYKNNQYESSLKTLEPKPSTQMNFRVEKTPSIIDKLKQMNEGNKLGNKELHRSISYDKEFVIPSPTKPIIDVSPKISELKNMKSNSSGRLLDSLDKHIDTKETEYGNTTGYKLTNSTTREDAQRHSLEQDRYKNRLNQMNSKQLMIFDKYLSDQLIPTKDKEKQLEEIERIKRKEAKIRLETLDQNSVVNKKALK